MASLNLRTAGDFPVVRTHFMARNSKSRPTGRIRFTPRAPTKMAMTQLTAPPSGDRSRRTDVSGGPEKFDRWMRQSVAEIVKNLEEAPLFVHVYGGDVGSTVKTERAVAEDWPAMAGKWAKGEEPSPEGIILVEELKEEDAAEMDGGDCTKAWGVLIQGKGGDGDGDNGGVGCYLLKTSRVGCGGGLGLFCTHYCLVKVKSFRETLKSQFTNSWLA